MPLPLIVLVGGFLGAGKTSLILSAAKICRKRGMRVAAIMNDQDSGLVDTRLAEANHLNTREIAGGCFCCRFSDLLEAAEELSKYKPDVIFAEPVGSCIDLSATIIQPLRAYHRGAYRMAPLTVLVDPVLAAQAYSDSVDKDLAYLYRAQVDEADILCATKADLYSQKPLPFPLDFSLSAKTGENLDLWLDEVIGGRRIAGARLLKVDYARYAEAEAALGWLNVHTRVSLKTPKSPALLVGPLLADVEQNLTASGIQIAHLKIFDQTNSGFIRAGVCATGYQDEPEGDLLADPEHHHDLAINLRAIADPHHLQRVVSTTLLRLEGSVEIVHQRSFRPEPPKPEHHFSEVVS